MSEAMKHPKGLYVLFFTEMWERFSYYGMRAILVLFLVATVPDGGLGWEKASALSLYGWYTGFVYIMAIPGGILADKVWGQKYAVMIGGIFIIIGHAFLTMTPIWAFWAGLTFIVLGVGSLKPNISTLVGGLYEDGDIRRDKGFTIFYIGINIGALFSPLIVGYIGETIGWRIAFGLAGVGMFLGQIIYFRGLKYLKGVGEAHSSGKAAVKVDHSKPLTKIEKDRVIVLLISFLIIIVFWGAFEQAGGLMNLYAKEKVDRIFFGWEMPASWLQSANPFFIVILGTFIANFWAKRSKMKKEVSAIYKMAIGTMIMGAGFLMMNAASLEHESTGTSAVYWLVAAYFLHTVGELCASPVALSFITKLAPVKYASIMMGIYFAATGLGNIVAGQLGALSEDAGEFQIFTGIFIFTTIFGILLLTLLKKLKAMTHGAEEDIVNGGGREAMDEAA
ncbi:MAG: MFS transporter [Calditrichaeota bacterium]|nr:MAG: MFS transporter [Calditrichota bacterium]